MIVEIVIIIALVLLNGVFAGAEMATVTVRKTRLDELVASGKSAALAVQKLRSFPERLLATVQIGITVVGAAAAAYGGDTLSERLVPFVSSIAPLSPWARGISFGVVVIAISYLSLVLGELVPKSLALRAPESYALLVGRPLLFLAQVARPVVWVLTASSNVVLKLFGDKTSFTEALMSPDELKSLLEDARNQGSLHPRVGEIAARALDLSDLVASDVMVPRNRMVALDKDATTVELRDKVLATGHARYPVYDGSLDNVTGYVSVRDAYLRGEQKLELLRRDVPYVPELMRAVDVLGKLQTNASQMAIVVDEHGGTAGLLTREDLVEELVGEMLSERGQKPRDEAWRSDPDGSAVLGGHALVRDVNRALRLGLPESDAWSTISGLVLAKAGHVPTKGETVGVDDRAVIEVLDASPHRIRSVRVRPVAPADVA